MIAVSKNPTKAPCAPKLHAAFLALLPAIVQHARVAFRHLNLDAREEAIEEVLASAFVALHRLHELGKEDLAYAGPLAGYAVRQVRSGRLVGGKLNVRDLSSRYCQRAKGVTIERLDRYVRQENDWREVIVEDRRAGPAETAAMRIDFGDWLDSLPTRQRSIAENLAIGERTQDVARQFNISAGRVSQMRRELMAAWNEFHGEPAAA